MYVFLLLMTAIISVSTNTHMNYTDTVVSVNVSRIVCGMCIHHCSACLYPAPPGGAPLSLTTRGVGGTSARLAWDPPTDTGGRSDLSYTVTYRIGNTTISINSPNTEITLINLLPFTTYNVTVSAENGVSSEDISGRENRTAIITVTTGEPSEWPPTAVTLSGCCTHTS